MNLTRPDDVAFPQSCVADPADALPRLVWADLLDETGRQAAASYLRGEMGPVLIRAAADQLAAGGDPRRTPDVVLWLAGGGAGRVHGPNGAGPDVAGEGDDTSADGPASRAVAEPNRGLFACPAAAGRAAVGPATHARPEGAKS